jgi:predicted regulator of Ras-like GTPase activity (Roadblock/LC7/MglB family)
MAETPLQVQGRLGLPTLPGPTQGGIYQGGMRNLLDLINNPGKADSVLLNQELADVGRGTTGAVTSKKGALARSGLGRSGLASAMLSATEGGGARAASRLRSDEARRRESLLRGDLGLIDRFIQQPTLSIIGADRGVQLGRQAMDAQTRAQQIAAASALGGSLASSFGSRPSAQTSSQVPQTYRAY